MLPFLGHTNALTSKCLGNHPAQVLDREMEAFIVTAGDIVNALSYGDFEEYKMSLASLFLESFKELDEEACYFWTGIDDTRGGFDLFVKDAALVRTLTKKVRTCLLLLNHGCSDPDLFGQDILDVLEQYLFVNGPMRAKLSVRVGSQRLNPHYHSEPLRQALQQTGASAGVLTSFEEVIKQAPTGKGLLESLQLSTKEGPVFEAVQEALLGHKPPNDLQRMDIPVLQKTFDVSFQTLLKHMSFELVATRFVS